MEKFQKLLDHPDKDKIITKLTSGDSPKEVVDWLKSKYGDNKDLLIPQTILKDFIKHFGDHYGFVKNVISDKASSKLDKYMAESVLNNKTWKERIEQITSEELDFKRKMIEFIHILEARTEQLFDMVQADPSSLKYDNMLDRFLDRLASFMEKADKIINDRPDMKIEHNYSIQMVEQQTVVIQEAVRRTLEQMAPEQVNFFMEALNEEMQKLKPTDYEPSVVAERTTKRQIAEFIDKEIEDDKAG